MEFVINANAIIIPEIKRCMIYLGKYKTSTSLQLAKKLNNGKVIILDDIVQIKVKNNSLYVKKPTKITKGAKPIKWWDNDINTYNCPDDEEFKVTDIVFSLKGKENRYMFTNKDLAVYLMVYVDPIHRECFDEDSLNLRDVDFLNDIIPCDINYVVLTSDDINFRVSTLYKLMSYSVNENPLTLSGKYVESYTCSKYKIYYLRKLLNILNLPSLNDLLIVSKFWYSSFYLLSFDELAKIVNIKRKITEIDKRLKEINGVGICLKCENDHIIGYSDGIIRGLITRCPICSKSLRKGEYSIDIKNLLEIFLSGIKSLPRDILGLMVQEEFSAHNNEIILYNLLLTSEGCLDNIIEKILAKSEYKY
ncbi:hypothetical protein [Saccharolobus islandicus]|jgi:hypothetical protein|uniref:Uncharacterized protein n=1 Tax=Saccharolobus islandicus (strain HVE10/4) TaxID=930943 RepID=F0NJU5_SACI0|nr:hypothetical protein [Sulfolobus islandicus]ADX82261.1 hypothetical protein SiH_0908 [Sulfolobus islandicus HVE10/4]WCM36425.1 hypothetical protein GO599_02000 [Sulfolobus islandicus]